MPLQELISLLKKDSPFFNVTSGYERIAFHRTSRIFNAAEQQEIQDVWDKLLYAGKAKFDSNLVALEPLGTYLDRDKTLHVTGYVTDYRSYRGTLNDPSLRVWITGPSGVVRLEGDDKSRVYVFGERKETTSPVGGNLEFVPAGYLEAKHFQAENPFLETLYDELEEELGIPRARAASVKNFWTGQMREDICAGRKFQDVCIDFLMDVSASPEEALEFFESGMKREHTSLHFVKEDALADFADANLSRLSSRTKFSLANLIPSLHD
jgi:hypothetical protein